MATPAGVLLASLAAALPSHPVACGAAPAAAAGAVPAARQSAPAGDPQEALWLDVTRLREAADVALRTGQDFDEAIRRRIELLGRLRQYGVLYPGGRHRDEGLRLELLTLFEVGTLSGGSFGEFRARLEEYARHPPAPAARSEAAYWATILDRTVGRAPDAGPASAASARASDEAAGAASRAWLGAGGTGVTSSAAAELPAFESRLGANGPGDHWLRLACRAFQEAEAAGDVAAMRRLADTLAACGPEAPQARLAVGRVLRTDALGRPFWLCAADETGRVLDSRQEVGRPVLIVVWDSARAESVELLRQLEARRRRSPELRIYGVNLDVERAAMRRTCEDLELRWPQHNDGRGPANAFAMSWGVSRTPVVFGVDRRGNLRGWAGLEDWRGLVEGLLSD